MFRAPFGAHMPQLLTMLDDLPRNPAAICDHLEISRATLARYIQAQHAPRPVMLSLFWETRWGRSAADCEAANAAQLHAQHATMLRQQNVRLHRVIERLERDQDSGAANAPVFLVG